MWWEKRQHSIPKDKLYVFDYLKEFKVDVERFRNKRIAVLLGGVSSEREISIRSGENIYNALVKQGFDVIKLDVDASIARRLVKENVDIAFIALHGKYGEDGCIQGLLEILGIPYTGSGVLASAVGMNKLATKKILMAEGIKVPDYIRLDTGEPADKLLQKILNTLGLPIVLKPIDEGSSVGVIIVKEEEYLRSIIRNYLRRFPYSYAEKYIKGKELTVGVMGNGEEVEVLPIMELRPKKEFYDFEAKYTKGMTDFIIPPDISEEQYRKVAELSIKAFKALECKGVVRFDMMLSEEDGEVYFLEVNTIPGMTETSDIPAMAKAAGISFEEIVLKILSYVNW